MKTWNEFTPASIYDHETGNYIAEGLQNCIKCNEASNAAVSFARDRGEPVVLEDADGIWIVHPDGTREEAGPEWQGKE